MADEIPEVTVFIYIPRQGYLDQDSRLAPDGDFQFPDDPVRVYHAEFSGDGFHIHSSTSITVDFDPDGRMYPRTLTWEDGEKYEIDKVKDVRPAHAERAGGQGDRYTIMVAGHEKYLFFEHNTDYGNKDVGRWFVERKE